MKLLHFKAREILTKYCEFSGVSANFISIPRESHAIADTLANRAIATKKAL
jgi:hypothetical protein